MTFLNLRLKYENYKVMVDYIATHNNTSQCQTESGNGKQKWQQHASMSRIAGTYRCRHKHVLATVFISLSD